MDDGTNYLDILDKDKPYPVEHRFAFPLETVANVTIMVVLVLLIYFTLKSRLNG